MANIDKLFIRISELNLTAKKVSDATGISTGNLSDWKKGRCLPSAEKLEKLADYLNCSVDYLLGRTDYPEINNGQFEYAGVKQEGTVIKTDSGYIFKLEDK